MSLRPLFAAGLAALLSATAFAAAPVLRIPRGTAISSDGVLGSGEWDDAVTVELTVQRGWTVRALLKHDGENLYVAFQNLVHEAAERYPEVLLDAVHARSPKWRPGQWWLHASYDDCEANGAFNVYVKDGQFQCAAVRSGWSANNFPLGDEGVVEFQIGLAKLREGGARVGPGARIGLALDVTDARGKWAFWPAGARLDRPVTWAEAVLAP